MTLSITYIKSAMAMATATATARHTGVILESSANRIENIETNEKNKKKKYKKCIV